MSTNRTAIEVQARGEFGQLTRGLRDVRNTLNEVTGVVNKGARSGGFFSDEQVRSVDVFARRFEQGMGRVNQMVDEQSRALEALNARRRRASGDEVSRIDAEIDRRGRHLDQLEAERREIERIFALRRQEAAQFSVRGGGPAVTGSPSSVGGRGSRSGGQARESTRTGSSGSAGASAADVGTVGGSTALIGVGKALKGIGGAIAMAAGVSMTLSQLMKWEGMAEQRATSWQPLLQRTGMNRGAMEGVGVANGMDSFRMREMLDAYTQTAGNISTADARRMAEFSKGYGVDATTTAGVAGQMAVRGYGTPTSILDRASGIAEASGMGPRMLEVLETSQAFLQSMDKSLRDNSGNSILAYTARINQIGKEQGAEKLTGMGGAGILEQMGQNIFNPSNTRWQAVGTHMLKKYGGDSVQGKDTFDLMQQWQTGFQSPENMKALASYMTDMTKGMSEKQARQTRTVTLQQAMGGDTTFAQAQQFGEMTNWLQKFSPDDPAMQKFLNNGVGSGSAVTQKSEEWKGTLAAKIEITNAKWMQAQLEAGEIVIPVKLQAQDAASNLLGAATDQAKGTDNSTLLGGALATVVGYQLLKGRGRALLGRARGRTPSPTGGGGGITSGGTAAGGSEIGPRLAQRVEPELGGWWSSTRNAGARVLKGVGSSSLGRNVVGGGIIAGELLSNVHPQIGGAVKGGVKAAGEAVQGVVRSVVNVAEAATKYLPHSLQSAGRVAARGASRLPIVGGAIDAGVNHYMFGQSWGESLTRGAFSAVGGTLGAMGGGLVGGPVGALAGGVGMGMAGDQLGKYLWNFGHNPTSEEKTKGQHNYLTDLANSGTVTIGKLSKEGVDKLAALSADGTVEINGLKNLGVKEITELNKNGVVEITRFSDKGIDALLQLRNEGLVSLAQFDQEAVSAVKQASAEHTLSVQSLTSTGSSALEGLQKDGLVKIGDLQADGSREITVLSDRGAASLAALQSQGYVRLKSVDENTDKKLKSITKTHEDLAKDMKLMTRSGWDSLQDAFGVLQSKAKNFLKGDGWKTDGDLSNDANGEFVGKQDTPPSAKDYWSTKDSGATTDSINKALKGSPMAGMGDTFVKTGKKYGIDPALLVGISYAEQGFSPYQNNAFGLMADYGHGQTPEGLGKFDSVEEGIDAAARNLVDYAQRGKYTLSDIQKSWAPIGAGNDPNGLNQNWIDNVMQGAKLARGHANGMYVGNDHFSIVHAGEEILSRSKTSESLRKTGKLPSQVLNEALSQPQGKEQSGPATGPMELKLSLHLTSDQNIAGLPVALIEQIARSVFQEAALQWQKQNVTY